ncbi:hypothetical protein ACGF8B_15515 [Streptomyces sp. NPDC047917]|uniref:hypothetical protein n=1 Tax=Streptomyces sp. NPDC047917 TaxID=3365491 RepID=UPI0037159C44
MSKLCEQHGTTLPAAIALPRTHPAVVNVTRGMRKQEQAERNVELHAQHVPDALWGDLRAQGLIRSDVPDGTPGRTRCP